MLWNRNHILGAASVLAVAALVWHLMSDDYRKTADLNPVGKIEVQNSSDAKSPGLRNGLDKSPAPVIPDVVASSDRTAEFRGFLKDSPDEVVRLVAIFLSARTEEQKLQAARNLQKASPDNQIGFLFEASLGDVSNERFGFLISECAKKQRFTANARLAKEFAAEQFQLAGLPVSEARKLANVEFAKLSYETSTAVRSVTRKLNSLTEIYDPSEAVTAARIIASTPDNYWDVRMLGNTMEATVLERQFTPGDLYSDDGISVAERRLQLKESAENFDSFVLRMPQLLKKLDNEESEQVQQILQTEGQVGVWNWLAVRNGEQPIPK